MTTDDQKIPIIEIFGPTIQGEGSMIGQQTMFIRTGGCDYDCKMCDSRHAIDSEEIRKRATYMTQQEIAEATLELMGHIKWVTLSGGNPCLWELHETISLLQAKGKAIALETQGTYWKEWVLACDEVTVSPKAPGMGEKFEPDVFYRFMAHLLTSTHMNCSVKIVCFTEDDVRWAANLRIELDERIPMYLSIGNSLLPGSNWAQDDLADVLLDRFRNISSEAHKIASLADVKVLPQLHVLAWGNEEAR